MALRLKKVKEALMTVKMENQTSVTDKSAMMDRSSSKGLVDKVRSKLTRKKSRKCDKCRLTSETCRPNESFISGRKHYLCEDCRVSSDNMKNIYSELRRNLGSKNSGNSVQNSQTSSDFETENHSIVSHPGSTGAVRRTAPVESGYETETHSCRASPVDSGYETGPGSCPPSASSCSQHPSHHRGPSPPISNFTKPADKEKMAVFSSAFRGHDEHLRDLQARSARSHNRPAPTQRTVQHSQTPHKTANAYDGYLVQKEAKHPIRYSVKSSQNSPHTNDNVSKKTSARQGLDDVKLCTLCGEVKDIAFRLPTHTGWLCEDCMDAML